MELLRHIRLVVLTGTVVLLKNRHVVLSVSLIPGDVLLVIHVERKGLIERHSGRSGDRPHAVVRRLERTRLP
jgi:hypothetical protein